MSWFARGEVEQLRRDLDHERVARGAIEAEIERLHAGFDAVPVGIVLADERGKQLVRSRAAAERHITHFIWAPASLRVK